MPASRWKEFRASLGHLAALVALVGGCAVIGTEFWPRMDRWQQRRLADDLAARIVDAPDDQVKAPVRQLAALGTPALGRLVEAAASPRDAVAHIAQQEVEVTLSAALIQMREEPTLPPSETLLELSGALADHISRFGPEGQRWARRLAMQMIDASDRLPPESAAELLAATSRVLDGIPPRKLRQPNLATPLSPPSIVEPVPIDLSTLAGPSERVISTPSIEEPNAQPLTEASDESLREEGSTASPGDAWVPKWIGARTIPAPAPPPPLSGNAMLSVSVRDGAPEGLIDVPTPLDFQRRLVNLRQLPNQELLARLATADKFLAGAIRMVLSERGIPAVEADMASRLKRADEPGRLEIVDEVSHLPAAAARRLLRMLLSDASGEVRLRALTRLATTNDPEIEELARTLAVEDQDPRVAELATKLLKR